MRIRRSTPRDTWTKALFARRVARAKSFSQQRPEARHKALVRLDAYFYKMRGDRGKEGEVSPVEVAWSFIGSFIGIGLLAWCSEALLAHTNNTLMLATFGASAMLLFGAPQVPFAQPRNVAGGHIVSALVGVTAYKLAGGLMPGLAEALAVSCAIAAMHATGTLHPPGGGTALMMTTAPELIQLGYAAVLFPVVAGVLVLMLTALVVNNLSRRRRYPMVWW